MIRRSLLLLVTLLVCACAAAPGYGASSETADARPLLLDPQLEVRNDHWMPMRIFLVSDRGPYFLGDVEPGGVEIYRIPRELIRSGTLRLLADPRGSTAEHLTEPVRLGDGRHIAWRLKKNLDGSRPRVL